METRTLVFVIMAGLVALVAGDCSKSSSAPCKFTCGDNVLDLSPLARTHNTPLIQDKISSDGSNKYSFSPCSTFTEGNCTSVAVCQLDPLGQGPSFPVGTLDSLAISADGSTLTYSDSYQGMTRKAVVTLKCDATAVNASLDIAAPSQAESSVTTYPMTLTTKYACMSAAPSSSAPATSPAAPVSSDRPTTVPPTTAGSNVTTVPPADTTTPPKRNDTTTQPPSSNSTDVTTAPPSSNTTSGVTTMPPQTTVVNNGTTPAKSNTTGVVTTVPVPVSGKTTTPKNKASTTPYKTTTALASVTKSAGWLVTMLIVAARLTV